MGMFSVWNKFYQFSNLIKELITPPIYSYKNEGILYPSGEKQEQLMREFYSDLKLDPRKISYVEAHGTGKFIPSPFIICLN